MKGKQPWILDEETEEKLSIQDYFRGKRHGFFIEVGANEPVSPYSQTWHLENELEWTGILVEPNPALAAAARNQRPRSHVIEAACTSPELAGSQVVLYVPVTEGGEVTGHASIAPNADEHDYDKHREIEVRAVTLNEILAIHMPSSIDFLSIDVEGAELAVLRGLDLIRWRPTLILLEDKHLYLAKHRLLRKAGYRLARRLNRNCWYIADGHPMPRQTPAEKLRLWKRMYISIWWKKLKHAIHHKTWEPLKNL